MKLLPTLKENKRYIVFEVLSAQRFSFPEIKEAVDSALQFFLGQLGLSKAAPMLLKEKFSQDKQRFVVKVNHKYTDEVKSALILSKKIKNTSVIIKSIITSGTLKKINSYL